jgi:hypothetical protein
MLRECAMNTRSPPSAGSSKFIHLCLSFVVRVDQGSVFRRMNTLAIWAAGLPDILKLRSGSAGNGAAGRRLTVMGVTQQESGGLVARVNVN